MWKDDPSDGRDQMPCLQGARQRERSEVQGQQERDIAIQRRMVQSTGEDPNG